jgi:hypothetical protein
MKHVLCAALSALSAVAAAGTAPQPAGAQDCATVESVTEQIRHGTPEADIRVIAGAPASRLRSGISALVGQTVPEGGSYLIARMPGAPVSYVVRFVYGCATHHGRFPDRLLRSWIDGSPA